MTINVDPVLFHLFGHLHIRWYGLMIGLAIAAGLWVALRGAGRKDVAEEHVWGAALWAILAGLVGARLFHVVDYWSYYAANAGQIFTLQQSGLAIYGALFGGLVAVVAYARWQGLSFWRLADLAAPALPLGQAIGRIGCLINGCNYGLPTDLPWGVTWTHPGAMVPRLGVTYHPAQVYDLLWALAVFGVVWAWRKRVQVEGALFLLYLSLYSAGRFFISFLRDDNLVLLGLRQAQVVGLVSLAVAVPLMVYLNRRQVKARLAGE